MSLGRDDTHFLCGVWLQKIISAIKPSPVIRCIDNRRHAVMNLSDQIVCFNGNDAECPLPISGKVAPVLRGSEGRDAEQLVRGLRRTFSTDNAALLKQLGDLDDRANALTLEISAAENALDALAYQLFGLTPAEIKLVEAGS